ncbi:MULTISPECIES: RICIN domain-containing protein [Streptomyces]|uniref:RICIN domain-containing protein n=1 Tax=Streptomyces arenae TaxID=29301 RepID=UPI00265858B0|nr:RICIN domain-containing protein [Streptomyces arenae]MCG7209100.1 RICIN domain-containing protein [Streptomyces arenae]
MPTPLPPRPPYPPPGGGAGESDESLAAPLRAGSDIEASRSAALLMARHWRPVQEYAVICLAVSGPVAHMVAAAAFHQVLDRVALGETADAIRPRLLVAVRDTVANWSDEDRIAEVLPDLGKPAGGRGMRAAKPMAPENRALAERSFLGLPALAQSLLWHSEVEAEPITVPAGLLGMDTTTASAALEDAREKFREGCVRAHRDLAPSQECRYYNRLLDVPIRRGGGLLPDVQEHLAQCPYCRAAAEQLGHVEGGLGVLLVEAVLGWGARRYLDSRPGRKGGEAESPTRAARRAGGGGGRRRAAARTRILARIPVRRPPGSWSSKTLLTSVGVAGAGLLASVLAVSALSGGGDGSDAVATAGLVPGGTDPETTPDATPTSGTAGLPAADQATRLRNAAAQLCLDINGAPKAGAGVVLAVCSTANTQQWTFESDGELRSVAGDGLCLDSHADAGVVILGTCAEEHTGRAKDVRYDLTVQGELLPHWDESLALATGGVNPGDDIVVKVRDHTSGQHWLTDAPVPSQSPGSLSVAGTGGHSAHPAELTGN